MEDNQLEKLIRKYLDGSASEEEKRRLESWYLSFENKKGLADHLTEEENAKIQGRLLRSINERIDSELYKQYDQQAEEEKVTTLNFRTWFIAASIAVIIGFFWYRITITAPPAGKKVEWVEIKASKAEIKKVTLPDGSLLWVNAESQVKFKKNFEGQTREVWLKGEAYFDVVHDKSKAFNVYSGTLTTHVLGTAFNVSAYESDRKATVTVTKGKVAVASEKKGLTVLVKNQQIIYNKTSQKYSVSESNSEDLMSWTKGRLVFRDQAFRDIAVKLERWYNVKIDFHTPGLGNCKLTASFDTGLPINDVLLMLCRVSGNKKVRQSQKNIYTIEGQSCN